MSSTLIAAIFLSASQTYALPKGLLSALCYVESHHNVHAINPDDKGGASRGVCQVQERTARFLGFKGTVKDLMDPKTNAYYAAKYLKWQLNRYHDDVFEAVASYNAGSYIENEDGLPVNKLYVLKVMRAWKEGR